MTPLEHRRRQWHCRSLLRDVLLLLILCWGGRNAEGDVFYLKSGARVRGEWLNMEESPVRRYVVKSPGCQITLESSQVTEHIREPSAAVEYDRRAPGIADTAEEQWKFAEWCRSQGLGEQRKQHLWRVIELEPEHAPARTALGFSEINGKWTTRKDFFEERGFVYYQGKWRLPQEVDLIEERRGIERQEREWFAKLKQWRGQLGTEHEPSAIKSIQAIRDPLAIKALAENLRREKSQNVRLLLVAAVSNVPSGEAINLLTQTALNDADVEIFHACVDRLVSSQTPSLPKALSEVLKDPNNIRVNRAAHILGRMQNRKAIPALIAALITTHQVAASQSNRSNATFAQPLMPSSATSPSPASAPALAKSDTAFTAGRQPPVTVQTRNQEVLAALVKLSGGQSFGFDQRAWSNWWASASRAP